MQTKRENRGNPSAKKMRKIKVLRRLGDTIPTPMSLIQPEILGKEIEKNDDQTEKQKQEKSGKEAHKQKHDAYCRTEHCPIT